MPGAAAERPEGREIARRINARDEGESSRRRVTMTLIDRRGGERQREAIFLRRFFGEEKRTAVFYEEPATVKGTAFLAWDHPEVDREDDQWLYLPALRRVRRIAATDRGDSFLGTDLSYEDIKNETRVAIHDYRWRTLGRGEVDGHACWHLEAVPVSEDVAHELGYGRVEMWVDAELWMVRKAEYWDPAGRHLKTSRISEVRRVDGIWTPHRIDVENHRSGHSTVFEVSDVAYEAVPEDVFSERALRHGPR